MTKLGSVFLLLAGLQLAWSMPAAAQNAENVRINVLVTNAETGEPLFGKPVYYNESASNCNMQHPSEAVLPTTRSGEVTFTFPVCTGPSLITVPGGDDFDTQRREFQIVPGQYGYNVFVKLEPKGRVVHIRVQGRLPNGRLVGVHFAAVYDRNNRHVATTDYNGIGTARVREVVGETVTLRAEGSEGVRWRPASASYIAGASESGTRMTRSDDYVNFVLSEEEQPAKQELSLQIRVLGTKGGSRAPIEHALIYDEQGHYLTSTDSRGHAAAIVEETFGETFRLKAEAQHWSTQTLTLLARAETRSASAGQPGSKYLRQDVNFLLQPATGEVGDLVVEVLDRDTNKPVPAAAVRLYKPTSFPGTLVGFETTNHSGEATFDAAHVGRALMGQEARVGVKHGGYLDAVQTVSGSLVTGEAPRYVVYLKPNKENTKWSGTWIEGPYTIQISGGTGALGYNALRSQGAGTCCPLVDQNGGNCQVIGSKAICQYHGHYHDSAKDVTYGGHGTLTLSGDYIQYIFTQVTGSITLSSGQPCPDIAQCTGLHPGATSSGSWTRKKQ